MNELELLTKGARELGLTLTSSQLKQLKDYKDYTLEINKSLNLTSIIDDREFIIKHFLDSFALSKVFDFNKVESIMDMGTGAGIPGIPMKILYPDISFVLVDSLNKKIQFLKDVVKRLKLNKIDCIHGRAEELGQDIRYRESFDVVTSRAVAHLAVLSEYCIPFLKPNGVFLCLKGPKYKEEIEEGKGAVLKLGGCLEGVESIKLPFSNIIHYILIIRKTKHTPTKFPRKPGKPTKSPIK